MITGTKLIEKVPSAYSYPLLIKQLLHTPIYYAPDQEIVYRDQKRFTYREFYARVKKLASGLQALGVKPGDMVAVLDWDSYRYLEAYFAIPGIGAILHIVNIRLSPEQMIFTMRHAEDTVVLVAEEFAPVVDSIKDQVPSVKKWVYMKETNDAPAGSIFECEYEELLAKGTEDFEFPDFDENSQATMSYTTGTTGDPKGVYFSHRQLVLHTLGLAVGTASIHAQGRFTSQDTYMPITPMFHVHAWGVPYLATMLGMKQVYPGRYEPAMLLQLLIKEKVTFSHCVPTILHMLVSSPVAKQVDLRGWKVIIGGSALPKGLAQAAMDLGIDIYTGYGMSETCPVLTLANLPPDKLDADMDYQLKVRTSTGRPIPLVDLQVWDPQGKPLPRDGQTSGEIVVRAPWLTQGYYKAPDKGEELWRGGYLHTGDVANIDSEGYVKITDRLKDVIKTGGEWVSSLELESLISQAPGVSEVAVVGVPDEKWGERPLALVVAREGSTVNPEDIKAFMNTFVEEGNLSKWAIPDQIRVVPAIPKTSVGKIDKKKIRAEV
ncbi:MAG: fatty acid--CoA ligase [Deltaproteobacteria bacterium]|nr:fatty acid--CoA ligase [Deltaproteobacteria bacterium]